jgi:CheY-like chemotaxis protein
MNVIETLGILKKTPGLSSLPIILMSSADEQSLAFSPIEAGATKFITKPTLFADYIRLISELVAIGMSVT